MNLCAACCKSAAVSLLVLAAAAAGAAPNEGIASTQAAGERIVDIRIAARKPAGGVRTLRARQGERIVLRVLSDENVTIHVHGYDAEQRVTPGTLAEIVLVARWVGRFPVTAHLPHASSDVHRREPTLLYLEVHPE
jgi:hypothetical protein